ncbi:hypothetical protein DAEQUDRAFT_763212 [Daedalea quercina L-15889]|uniref:Uncharacterized protein n=1 Tax=Daedalea quercina L-15889 TaxID=1314783 RepID=A0A165SJJ5_9APHY|nr:hypothetical protein DAEQUDRAFT_763212 [Daedalea quercina L-15889]
MLQLVHNDPHERPASAQKPFSSVAYRRGSVPEIHSAETSSFHLFHHLPARAPLAPLHCQQTHASLTDTDHQMSVSPRSALPGYAHADRAQERERAADHLRYIGRPIVPTQNVRDEAEVNYSATRRRSIPSHSHNGTTALRHPPIYTRTSGRRPSHSSSSSVSSHRRPSLPIIHLQPSPPAAAPPPEPYAYPNSCIGGPDDLYSNLSSFTFGSARTSRSDHSEMVNPLVALSGTGSADRTPRPSISGPDSSTYSGSSTRSRTPRTRAREPEDEECRADDEDDEAEQQTRAKMRAMNDGTRRPSLPMNIRPSDTSRSPRRPSASTSVQRAGKNPFDRGRDSTPETSEAETESGTHGEDGEHDAEAGDFDTDVEMDDRHAITASGSTEMSDAASQHTFGGDYREYVYNSSTAGHSDDRMSVSEASEHDDDVPELPMVTQTQYTIDSQGNVAVVQGRRGSIPWATPEAPELVSSRDREDRLATLTGEPASHTGEDDQVNNASDPSGALVSPQSQRELQPQNHASDGSEPFSGFNLNYILGSRTDNDGDQRSWHTAGSGWMHVDPHHVSPIPGDGARPPADFEAFDFQGWGAPVTGVSGRRPSTVTVSSLGEDAFMRHLQRYDPMSSMRALDWTFKRENADGTAQDVAPGTRWVQNSARAIAPGTQEIWRQAHVGRFKVDKLLMRAVDDPSKPPSQRVNVRHIVDPYSHGNTLGGPMAVVHKHSRAVAFSIFRKYDLFNRRHSKSRGGSTSMPTSSSILLATKRVQEQYTSTRTTSQLNSHGLLKDGDDRSRPQTASSATESTRASEAGRSHSSDAAKRRRPIDKKGKGRDSVPNPSASSGQTSSSNTDEESSLHFAKNYASSTSSGPSAPVSPTIAETHYAYSVSDSDYTAARSSAGPSYSKYGSPPPTASSERAVLRVNTRVVDEDDEHLPPRTSHAEAFATLDQNSIEYFRGRTEQRVVDDSHSRSIAERLRRRLLGQNAVKVMSRPPSGPPTAALDSNYTPPWMTMAPRSRVEERDRVIQNLNESFKDVGLLPSFKAKGSGKRKGHGNDDKVNIFSHVPPDSLHMLLPLWPGETDPASLTDEDPSVYNMPVEERQYLLVYYVPQPERADKGKKKPENKKRARSVSRSQHASADSHPKTVMLTSFSVCARLISYHDLLGTGVRIPVDGLSITGPMAEAISALPSAAIRESRLETPCAIIGVCGSRHKGIEFLPEGLAKVGLAVSEPSATSPGERVKRSLEAEEEELIWNLTPIGRAALEMAWLGCLAMTSFGPEATATK